MKTKHFTLAVVCAATAMLILDIAVVNTALSRIAEDLKTNLSGLQWIVDAYTLALLANAFPGERERAGALAAYGATIAGAFAIGPAVGGALTSGLDWQWIFLINVPIGIACLGITLTHVQESRDPAARRIDWAGQGTLAAGLFLLVLALLRGNDQGWTSAAIITELGAAAALLAAFVAVERKVREPMLPLGLFRVPAFTGAQLAAFAISGSFFAVFLYATLYLQQILGLSAIEAGLVYVPGTVVMFGVSAATANLSEKVHPGVLVSGGLALVSAGKRAPAPAVAPALVTEGC
jgi:MFS family permease